MKSKTKIFTILLSFLLITLLVWLWFVVQKSQFDSNSIQCGKLIATDSYQTITDTQINTVFNELLQPNMKNNNFLHQELNSNTHCFMLKQLSSQGYFLSNENGASYLLQATHAHDDLHTKEIVKKLIQENNVAKYASISSVSRSVLDSSTQQSLSNIVAEKLVDEGNITTVIQIHGFSQNKRQTRKGKKANIIISSGSKEANLLSNTVYQCLNNEFTEVYLFGKNIFELGATENYLYGRLQNIDYEQSFLHIELSLELRKKLLDTQINQKFSRCLQAGEHNANVS